MFSLGSNEDQINPNHPMEDTLDQLTNMDAKMDAVESVATSHEIEEIMELYNLDLNKPDDDDTDILLQEVYLEYRPVFLLAQLGMELVFEIGRHLNKPDLAKLLLVDRTVSRHPVVRLRLLQLRHKKRILQWALGKWGYWRRWDCPKEAARAIRDREERVQRVLCHFHRFNAMDPSEKMRICECVHQRCAPTAMRPNSNGQF